VLIWHVSRPDDPDPPTAAGGDTIGVFGHPAALAAADARALAEIAAARVISDAAVQCWIGSWGGAASCRPPVEAAGPRAATSLVWSEGAIADLEHIRRYLTAFDPAAARRFADRVTAVAEVLGQQAAALSPGIGQHDRLRPFTLRYHVTNGSLAVMWIRQTHDGHG
jgi:plasmid stabilization system protein ParE